VEHATRFNIAYLAIALVGVMLLHDLYGTYRDTAFLPFSTYEKLLDEGKIKRVEITPDRIRGELHEALDGKHHFVTNRVEPDLAARLEEKGVEFSGKVEDQLLPTLLSWVLPVLFFVAVWIFLMRRMATRMGPGGGFLAVGKSKAKVYVETDTKVTFQDVAGVDEAKAELQEIVAFLKDPKGYGRLGARMP
jgi:cell division protease FtsH